MYYSKALTLSLLTGCLALTGLQASKADTTQTVETTTVTSAAPVLNLPATGTYVVVDPISGMIKGNFDPVSHLVAGGSLQSGYVIVDRTSGGLLATVDASGRVIDLSLTSPSIR
jgi:hypothetical protein